MSIAESTDPQDTLYREIVASFGDQILDGWLSGRDRWLGLVQGLASRLERLTGQGQPSGDEVLSALKDVRTTLPEVAYWLFQLDLPVSTPASRRRHRLTRRPSGSRESGRHYRASYDVAPGRW